MRQYAGLLALAISFTSTQILVACGSIRPLAPQPPAALPSPEVHADHRVTFRFRAPNTKEVSLALEGFESMPMIAGPEGIWTLTTAPLGPDFYGYSFVTDGVRAIDPSNPLLKPNLLDTQSVVHVPGPPSLPWEIADVPHGVLHRHFYRSTVVGDQRDFYVYTPPGYDAAATRTYPALYLLHGFSDDASAWPVIGRAHVIVDNLIAQRKATPMVVVMPLGYGAPDILAGGFSGFGKDRALLRRNLDKFRESLVTEVLPLVQSAYRVESDRDSRAIAGLSMGGSEALLTGLNDLDQFAWIGAFSAGGLTDDFDAEFPVVGPDCNSRLRLLWIACGTSDSLTDLKRAFGAWLRTKGVVYADVETPGGHTWMVWRRNLAAFAGLLFAAAR